VTLVLQDRDTQLLFAVTTVSLPECADTALNLLAMILRDAQDYIGQMPHIIAGDFQLPRAFNKNRGMLMSLGYHDLLGQISPGPTRFRRGYLPDVADYVFYRGPVAAMECLVRPLKRPDIDHEGSDHSPIYVFFFLGHITTVDY
jgi:endonuclease/exonuclease/phosphatase (EEP) superfamily protein YafD